MSKGFIVCVYEKIEDESLLKNYAVEAKKAVEKFGGKFLIRGGDKITTEGKEFLRTAVIEFSSFDVAKNFFYSNEYQSAHTILKDTVIRHHQIIKGYLYCIGAGSILLHKLHVATEQYGENLF